MSCNCNVHARVFVSFEFVFCFKIMVLFRHLNQSQFQNHTEEILFSLKFFIEHSFTVLFLRCMVARLHCSTVSWLHGLTVLRFVFIDSWLHGSCVHRGTIPLFDVPPVYALNGLISQFDTV